MSDDKTDKSKVKAILERIEEQRQEALDILGSLETNCEKADDLEMAKKYGEEYEEFNDKIDRKTSQVRAYLSSSAFQQASKTATTTTSEVSHENINVNNGSHETSVTNSNNTHRQLERIRIPIFNGDKLQFQQWYAAFTSCVDDTPLTPQFKMLRLEGCLEGEAAETIKGLGYSEVAYEAAKARLIRKYGGERRKIQAHLEELRRMKSISEGSPTELEKFADILERTVVTLKENDRKSDLEAGTLYNIVLEKISEVLLAQYYRWIKDNKQKESLEALNRWVSEEAEYQTHAAEIKRGFTRGKDGKHEGKSGSWRDNLRRKSFGTKTSSDDVKRDKLCVACGEKHPIWRCVVFKEWPGEKKWETAKRFGLCYRCLGEDHLGKDCQRSRTCTAAGCKRSHHPLLHETRDRKQEQTTPAIGTEGDTNAQKTTLETIQQHEDTFIALRTVPVILKNGKKRLLVNCFLDEGSDTTYVNEDVIEALGVERNTLKEKVTIQVANNEKVSFMSTTVKIGIESVDGKVDSTIFAKTSQQICGRMKPTSWVQLKHQWNHMKDILFPKLAQKKVIDVLLGSDYYNLMFPMKEIRGKEDEPSARLCPLGWTAIGRVGQKDESQDSNTRYSHTFRTHIASSYSQHVECQQADGELNDMVKRFWDLETVGITTSSDGMTPVEKLAWEKAKDSLRFNGERYENATRSQCLGKTIGPSYRIIDQWRKDDFSL